MLEAHELPHAEDRRARQRLAHALAAKRVRADPRRDQHRAC